MMSEMNQIQFPHDREDKSLHILIQVYIFMKFVSQKIWLFVLWQATFWQIYGSHLYAQVNVNSVVSWSKR